MDDITTQVKVT